MTRIPSLLTLIIAVVLAVFGGRAITAQDTGPDKYTVQVPGGLAFSEFRGYERWPVVSISHTGEQVMAVILGESPHDRRLPGRHSRQRQAVPRRLQDGKIHSVPKKLETFPTATVPGTLHDVDFMVKDSQRFADSGGWGWGAFKYDAASG